MQRPGVVRCIATLENVGLSVITGTFTPSPPVLGKILFFNMTFTGPATTVSDVLVREGLGGAVRLEYTAEIAEVNDAPGGIPYSVATPATLKAQATTDDAGATSTVVVTVDIEVV